MLDCEGFDGRALSGGQVGDRHRRWRYPVILDPADHDCWLTGTTAEAAHLLQSYPAEKMWVVREGDEKEDWATAV